MTPKQEAALRQALEALDGLYLPGELERVNKAIIALREALAEQPAQGATKAPGMAVQALAGEIVEALLADEKDDGYDLTAGLFGPKFSALVRRWAAAEWNTSPQPPQRKPLTDEELSHIYEEYHDCYGQPINGNENGWAYERAIIQAAHGIKGDA